MNLFEKQQKPFAIKLSDRVKEEIKKEFGVDFSNYKLAEYFIFISKDNWAFSLNKPPHSLITEAEFFGDGKNKLREKIHEIDYADTFGKLEQITDDFAVKFAEWVIINYPNQRKTLLKQGNLHGFYTTAELRQIFKNNHYE